MMTVTDGSSSTATLSRRRFIASAGAAGAVAIAGCAENNGGGDRTTTNDSGTLSGSINIAGSSTVFPLAVQMRQAFQNEHPEVSISVQSTGSGGGFSNYFCPGDTDFNNASRPIKKEEESQCSNNGVEPVELKVATDALTIVVNKKADWFEEDCITPDTLAKIWSPDEKPKKWSDVKSSWPDEKIQLFGPTDASGTFDYFTEVVLGEGGKSRADYKATEQDNVIIQGVENNKYSIGYLGFAYYTENEDRVKALGIDDGEGCVKPSLETAKSGEYTPLSRPLFTYPKKSALAKDHVAAFARFWLENATSKELVANEVGYVPLGPDEQGEMQDRLETAIEEANS
ncbi:MAG: phosphate transport system substrate-binding protein [Halobacteriales archaeon]|jgi:phosphate transport system substrate-binding protein